VDTPTLRFRDQQADLNINVYSLGSQSRDTFVYADHADDTDTFNGHSGLLWTCLEQDCTVRFTNEQSMKIHSNKFGHEYFRLGDNTSNWGKERHKKGDVTKSIPQGAPSVTQRKASKPAKLPATVVRQDVEKVVPRTSSSHKAFVQNVEEVVPHVEEVVIAVDPIIQSDNSMEVSPTENITESSTEPKKKRETRDSTRVDYKEMDINIDDSFDDKDYKRPDESESESDECSDNDIRENESDTEADIGKKQIKRRIDDSDGSETEEEVKRNDRLLRKDMRREKMITVNSNKSSFIPDEDDILFEKKYRAKVTLQSTKYRTTMASTPPDILKLLQAGASSLGDTLLWMTSY